MRILFCFALSALIRSKRNQNALNHQLFSTSGNFGVSRSNSGDTLCVCGSGILRQSKSRHSNAGKFLFRSQRKFIPVQTIGLGGGYNKAITQRNTKPLENKIKVATYRIEKGN